VFVPGYTRIEAAEAVASAHSYAETLRRLGLRPAGGNSTVLKRWLAEWQISTDHFDPDHARRATGRRAVALDEVLVEHSSYNRGQLKQRLYESGLKPRACELCGQGEEWRGSHMGLILDHINGVGDDNRLENLRIVCPNCNSTLDTHCGRRNRVLRRERPCPHCRESFLPRYDSQRFCSRRCAMRATNHLTSVTRRKVERPPYEQLMAELAAESYSAVARRYEVSDNAVRKWVRWYEADIARRGPDEPAEGD
jgi:transposase-like protein